MIFDANTYAHIHRHAFTEGYPGYKPGVQEAPNGDDSWDTEKRYSHIAKKYQPNVTLMTYFEAAYMEALRIHVTLDMPKRLRPDIDQCCMRILEYPVGASSAPHTDFDLFTLLLYRDQPHTLERDDVPAEEDGVSTGFHWGEMAEVAGIAKATLHRVRPSPRPQRSIVFFALPARDASLISAGDWLDERYARSRR